METKWWETVDLFAGPGGWDVAAHRLGLTPLGVEFDDAACATREAAGLRTLKADVSALEPMREFEGGGIIASPPCQAFSMAGTGHGRRALSAYEEAIERWLEGKPPSREELDEACEDERGHLVLEPLRWTLALKPMWLLCEQVEPVLPLWQAMARGLRRVGYSTWTGVLRAEQYGVPQTRKRAILIARRDGVEARQPPPTHRRYVAPGERAKPKQEDSLFDAPDPEHRIERGEEELLPWISMAEALGWDEGTQPAPAPTVTAGGGSTGGVEVFASKAARTRAEDAVKTGIEVEHRRGGERLTERWSADRPSDAVTTRVDRWRVFRSNSQANATLRGVDEPAPTITGGHDYAERHWTAERPSPTVVTTRKSKDGMLVGRQLPDGEGENVGGKNWTEGRPATTIMGDARVFKPDDHHRPGGQSKDAVRVTAQEAAMLQSFPPDYPWQGVRAKVFEQIGNAIPPLLAEAILREIMPR